MTPTRRLSQPEFIALVAMLYASVAFSIDSMLPALPEIGDELTPDAPNRAQLIVTAFFLGMGSGTFIMGPLSDALGRKTVIIGGSLVYIAAAALAWVAPSLELMLAARAVQGLGSAAPRVVAMAMMRDLYAGRQMARIMSIAMMIFMIFPAVAPLIGSFVIKAFDWRALFGVFILFATITSFWLGLRQPETLPPDQRRPLTLGRLSAAAREILTHRVIATAIAVQALAYVPLVSMISSVQMIYDKSFGMAESFPWWFAGVALLSSGGSLLNATIVVRLGMRRVIRTALTIQVCVAIVFALAIWSDALPGWALFPAFLVWNTLVMFSIGLIMGNINALAMEPVGHIAGMAASIIGGLATVVAVLIAAPIGLAFDGTPVPLAIGTATCSALALVLMLTIPRESPPTRRI